MLFLGQGVVFPMGSPFLLGLVSISSVACLITGLFRYALSDIGGFRLLLYTLATALLVLMAGRVWFLVVESFTYDTSADVHAGSAILAAWGATAAALIYGIICRVRKRVVAS